VGLPFVCHAFLRGEEARQAASFCKDGINRPGFSMTFEIEAFNDLIATLGSR
jgi:hypothetical protein